jgi:hypothetical protein
MGHVTHLFGDHALPGIVHLGKVAGRVSLLTSHEPLGTRLGNAVTITVVTIGRVGKSHDGTDLTGIL